ncbi:alpha/beta fold hydrolase [Rhizobium laguerreae]|uniref:alpha/beta fold hydrolase n=1 Tax=Rhizobium laguerreae TaxID=1076926 RepID=UPI001C91D319|nr:alpha/beta hydrolase [Rhizobium laguerreae]
MQSLIRRTVMLAVGAIIGATGMVWSASHAAAQTRGTVVLVHGAFADGSSWSKVILELEKKNLEVIAVQLPLTSLADDVAATKRAVDRAAGPVTLVGHSWGGSVITEAGMADKVRALVYVTAVANEKDTSFQDLVSKYPAAPGLGEVAPDAAGFLHISAAGVSKFFAPSQSEGEQAVLTATQGVIKGESFGEKVHETAWSSKPSWYVVTEKDQMIVPQFQEAMAKNINAKVTRINSDHVAMLSHPKEVAAVIEQAAGAK